MAVSAFPAGRPDQRKQRQMKQPDRVFRDRVDQVKDAVGGQRVAELLGLHGRGKRFFCPLCQPEGGRTPDLAVADAGFCCFKCNEKGDLIKLVQVVRGVDFAEAVAWLASGTGVDWPTSGRRSRSSSTAPSRRPADSQPATRQQPPAAAPTPGPAGGSTDVLAAFLAACRPVDGPALAYLTGRGISAVVVQQLGLRFCGQEFGDVMTDLEGRFGRDALTAAGLLTKSSKTGKVYPTFWPLFAKKVGFLVIPYVDGGRTLYLKARPVIDKAKAAELDVPRFLNTGGSVPCPFNADGIKDATSVLICEGETDALTALSNGYQAVGLPGWSSFKVGWLDRFRGKNVFLVMDADKAGDAGVRDIATKFDRAGLAVPRRVVLPAGLDLNDFFRDGMMEGRKEGKAAG